MSDSPPIVLSFAASDSTGGGGLQADVLTIASMGGHPLSVVTALTVQDTLGVESVLPIEADWIAEQARAVLEDIPVTAFKVGMVGSVEGIAAIAEIVADYPDIPLILDPCLASRRGDQLADDDIIDALREMLIPQATLITPNLLEARRLLQAEQDEEEEEYGLDDLAARLLALGTEYVMITGTLDPTSDVINRLYHEQDGKLLESSWPRFPHSYHGAGATLSAGIATGLASGLVLKEAVQDAQDYTWQTLQHAFRPGMGQHLPDRLYWAVEEEGGSED
ncbi:MULTISPECIES: bifunctional hydroxymethylpyrimidine kinase/phosphomethylpyrimidine kinase [Leeia]|uniref:hydroxymethylpyrimidine kinase n=1 Tax=Leeia aquatica TaxID=2725557 RepID=A0A847SCK9_9NEIS|nr:hydroxymethylpyrimidine/phosphomethylpyrimidine kinase [Leeia aquatica]NLR76587.1 hydroxymethylpyrimidine/phosphomethylpyrimidine kinase [Leeia aquatica]